MGHKEWRQDGKLLQDVIPLLQNFEIWHLTRNFDMNLMPILFCFISQVIGQ